MAGQDLVRHNCHVFGPVRPPRGPLGNLACGLVLAALAACGTATTSIGGVQYVPSTPKLFDSGQVKSGVLGESTTIQGISYEAGTRVEFDEKGRLREVGLVEDTVIRGIEYRREEDGYPLTMVRFGESGAVEQGALAKETVIDDVPYAPATRRGYAIYVEFHKNGKVRGGVLSCNATIQGITYKGRRPIEFYENGRPREGTVAVETTVQGTVLPAGSILSSYESGTPQCVTLSADATIQGVVYKGRMVEGVCFHETGKVRMGILAGETTVQGIQCGAGAKVQFDASGRVVEGSCQRR